MDQFKDQALLVSGAGGHLGRIAVEELLARGATKVIAGTRDPDSLKDLAAKGVEVRRIDFDDAELPQALSGVDRMLMISTVAANRREQQVAAVDAAKSAGVKHIVYTSAPNPRPNESAAGIADHYWTEVAIAASGLDFTLLRNHIYADMLPMSLESAKASGKLFDATGGRGRAYVARDDAARTAAGALMGGKNKEIHDVTGPAALTQEQVASILSQLAGKPIERVGLTGEQLQQGLTAAGLPPFMVGLLVAFDLDAAEGHHEVVSNAVEHFTGRKPTSVQDFLKLS